ncbi:nicotinate (nicotinamide) nucleotide adenylyltransferase [Oceanihabitans sediminis]|uniref:Probable nicotinate-nucleotide adenylyltransferase n=1 Tax=Oceanihabitans sediminis TaxID=1812012 RepID=A0A368P9I3_9FLAO|nr:nicotinate (nicotinamide) nucleotide adenylyltransferase [Oceanihabitans sediminis]MDX1277280.1 nicotinate (nicotinamide) nucleotide adenylyltransferase [Oceanihabitans sediminis]MDX1773110.1 nicotinate (nicotinamide) nucleotide adenylyltransferase [Oceanihabitans sediminis]RBP34804.1 nicotinate-nucleotide adenylyltransferase [Oceanihabitans sediminis]RCU58449.1 nicotinate-nucleotide adenylyltransferase [Oceanihabitans sediminis]
MKVGLYFGSFNPVHIGHLIIANHLAENSDLDQIWFVVTPHNPFKKKSSLLDNYDRLELVHLATKDYFKLTPSDIEFHLPQPNYTINTLVHLQEKFPKYDFSLIMGEDNLKSFHKWKNYEVILENHDIYVYPRLSEGKVETQFDKHKRINHIDAPIMELSSTFIRKSIKEGKDIRPMLPKHVWEYVDEMNFYR